MDNFSQLGVKPEYVKRLKELDIHTPTYIQKKVIPLLLEQRTDLVAQAETGTGKTAAYGLPLLDLINPKKKIIQGIILCPTRELAKQVSKQIFKFSKYAGKIFSEAVYGGEPIEKQISALQRPTHVLVATPGRLIELVRRKAVDIANVKAVILDEADEMLSMGFKKDIDKVLKYTAGAHSRWLFSATLSHEVLHIINTHFSSDIHKIKIKGKNAVNENVTHQYLICDEKEKFLVLMQFLQADKSKRGIVFCKTKNAVDKLTKQLTAKNIATSSIHGDLKQKERATVMRQFKNDTLRIIVATDIAARGIDVEGLSFVVHYQMPDQDEYYAHRSGRTGRAGKKGIALSLVTSAEMKYIRLFQKKFNIYFEQIRQVR